MSLSYIHRHTLLDNYKPHWEMCAFSQKHYLQHISMYTTVINNIGLPHT